MKTGNVRDYGHNGATEFKELSSPRTADQCWVSAKQFALVLGLVVLVTSIDNTRAATDVEFTSGQVIDADGDVGKNVVVADIDGDGDLDVLLARLSSDRVLLYENTDGLGTFVAGTDTLTTGWEHTRAVSAADINGDGYMDVLAVSDGSSGNSAMWFNNVDGSGKFSPVVKVDIVTDTVAATWITAADIDGDGDLDVLTASLEDSRVVWFENTDGEGTFGVAQNISTDAEGANTLFVADLDGDGDMDVVVASGYDWRVIWYENVDGLGTSWSGVDLNPDAAWATYVYAADVDGDGDLDVLSATPGDHRIDLYENIYGNGTFATAVNISNQHRVSSVVAADLDNDGDLDVVCCAGEKASNDGLIAWYENTDGEGNFSSANVVPQTNETFGECEVLAADLDGDGDLDLVAVFHFPDNVMWYENLLLAPTPSPTVTSTSSPTMTPTSSRIEEIAPTTTTSSSSPALSPTSGDNSTEARDSNDSSSPPKTTAPATERPVTSDSTETPDDGSGGDQDLSTAAWEVTVTVMGTVVGGVALALVLYFLNKHVFKSNNRTLREPDVQPIMDLDNVGVGSVAQ